MTDYPPLLDPGIHRDALATIRTQIARHRHRAMWARAIGDHDTFRREVAAIRSGRRACRTHATALALAGDDPRGSE